MPDLITNLLSYQDYLTISGVSADDLPEPRLAILALNPTINQRLSCYGITDVTTLSAEAFEVLKAWAVLYINYKMARFIGNPESNSGFQLSEVDDGFVKEVMTEATNPVVTKANQKEQLDELWQTFHSLVYVPDPDQEEIIFESLSVAKRRKRVIICGLTTQGTK